MSIFNEDLSIFPKMDLKKICSELDLIASSWGDQANNIKNYLINENKYLLFERIDNILSRVLTPFTLLFSETEDPEIKKGLAILLLRNGLELSTDYVIQLINDEEEYVFVAINALVEQKVKKAGSAFVYRLNKCGVGDTDLIVALIEGLNSLNIPIDEEIISKFSQGKFSWQVKSLFKCQTNNKKDTL